jgi:hypothetical protein
MSSFNYKIFVLLKIVLWLLQYEVSEFDAGGASFLLPENEVLLDEKFETNETMLPNYFPYSPSYMVEQILYEWFPGCARVQKQNL